MGKTKYKYEIAFSFLKEDENLATELNDLLSDRFSTFLYSKKQEDLAGTDGEETFNKVFGEESRVVVVLYRENWGKTPWTRIEETAIRNRAFEHGYSFTLFIPLDKDRKTPKWLPKPQVWIDLERWGIKGAASVIESRVQQEGGTPRPESIHDHAARIKRQKDAEEKRKQFLNSTEGVNCAKENVKKLLNIIQKLLEKISADTGFSFTTHRRNELTLDFSSEGIWIAIDWYYSWANSLDGSKLRVLMTKGPLDRPGVMTWDKPIKLTEKEFIFTTDYNEKSCWQPKRSTDLLSNEKLAEYCIKMLLNKIHKFKST